MLQCPVLFGPDAELKWFVAETQALTRFRDETPLLVRKRLVADTLSWVVRDHLNSTENIRFAGPGPKHHILWDLLQRFDNKSIDRWSDAKWEAFTLQSLWRICAAGVRDVPTPVEITPGPKRLRSLLLDATGIDSDALVHDRLIRYCASFTDQGFADWALPERDKGFFKAFLHLYQQPKSVPDHWMRGLGAELSRLENSGIDANDSVVESLHILGIPESDWEDFIPATLMALRGWVGMLRQMEVRPDRVHHAVAKGTLVDFLAVRLILERYALAYVAKEELDYDGPLHNLGQVVRERVVREATKDTEQRTFILFQLAQVLGWRPSVLHGLTKEQWTALITDIESFSDLERRRIYHIAYERRFRTQALDAVAVHVSKTAGRIVAPRFQAAFCIDAREESFRRHLEEAFPDVETFGVAGFFCVAMYYRGLADAHFAALCPIVLRPKTG